MGLRLGERKLLQAVGDCAVIWGGTLLIALFSERGYDTGPILLSLGILMALWVFFANAFDAYNVGVMQAVFRNVYTAIKVFVVTGVLYLLFAGFTGGAMPVIRPRISESLARAVICSPGARAGALLAGPHPCAAAPPCGRARRQPLRL